MTVVAIDGPAGAGKSSVARGTARALGFDYLDTGALYRATALAALEAGVDPDDGTALGSLADQLQVSLEGERVLLVDRDVSDRIRDEDVTRVVSKVAAHPSVRAALVARQRELASRGCIVIEGRDIGTVVAPDAPVKIYLTASVEERALRRARQLGVPESTQRLATLRTALTERDDADSGRVDSPLRVAADAVVIDSTGRVLEDVIDEVVARVRRVVDVS